MSFNAVDSYYNLQNQYDSGLSGITAKATRMTEDQRQKAYDDIVNPASKIANALSSKAEELKSIGEQISGETLSSHLLYKGAKKLYQKYKDFKKEGSEEVGDDDDDDIADALQSKIESNIGKISDDIPTNVFDSPLEGMQDGLQDVINRVGTNTESTLTNANEAVSNIGDAIKNNFSKLSNRARQSVRSVTNPRAQTEGDDGTGGQEIEMTEINRSYAPSSSNNFEVSNVGSLNNATEDANEVASSGSKVADVFNSLVGKAKDATSQLISKVKARFSSGEGAELGDVAEGLAGAGEDAGEGIAEGIAGALNLADAVPIIGEGAMLLSGLITAGTGIADAVSSSNLNQKAQEAGAKALAGVKPVVPQFGGHYVLPTNDALHNIGDHFSGF